MDWFDASEVKLLVPVKKSPKPADEATTRLKRLGASALTDEELLELLGVSSDGDVRLFLKHGLTHLVDAPELGFEVAPRLTARVLASVEIARRLAAVKLGRPKLFSPHAIAQWVRSQLVQTRREEMWVLAVNSRNAVLRADRVSLGGVDHCVVDPREALAPAVACRASAIVLLHTHPSGDPEPSTNDVALTARLKVAAEALNIRLLDHLVLADSCHVSMLERGLLEHVRGEALARRPAIANEDD